MSEELFEAIKAALEKAGERELIERLENYQREINEFIENSNEMFDEYQELKQREAWGR